MLVPLLAVALVNVVGFRRSLEVLEEFQAEMVVETNAIDRVRDLLVSAEEAAEHYVEAGDRVAADRFLVLSQQVDEGFDGLEELNTPRELRLLSAANARWKQAFAVAEKAVSEPGAPAGFDALDGFHDPLDAAGQLLADIYAVNGQEMAHHISEMRAQEHGQLLWALAILLVSSSAAVLMASRLRRSITAPLLRLQEAALAFGSNNLTHRIPMDDTNEFGRVAGAFNRMAAQLQQSRDELHYQALHDPLTGLGNRVLFMERIEHALARARRRMSALSVVFVDLDGFKGVNDTLGHEAGDELLVAVAERLRESLRAEDTVARLGGDEFGIVIEDTGRAEAVQAAERLVRVLETSLCLRAGEVSISASIGVATRLADEEVDELLRQADAAMYAAKARGKAQWHTFEPGLDTEVVEAQTLRAELQRAVERQEFVVRYQPVVDLQTGAVEGVEALVRWDHPERGLLPPAEFLEAAEQSGHILYIDKHVLQETCRQVKAWQQHVPAAANLSACVNLSARQLQHPGLAEDVAEALRSSGLDPHYLVLEITETMLIRDTEVTARELTRLKELGIQLALDDFGTGYSSLSYLRRFPIDIIKIDRSFVSAIGGDAEQSELALALVKLGKSLRLRTVAEGIEKSQQLDSLRSLGCELGQGYYFAKPLDAGQLESFLDSEVVAGRSRAQDPTS